MEKNSSYIPTVREIPFDMLEHWTAVKTVDDWLTLTLDSVSSFESVRGGGGVAGFVLVSHC